MCCGTAFFLHRVASFWQISHEISFLCWFFFINYGSHMDCALGRGTDLI
jgi:hypothetical protein